MKRPVLILIAAALLLFALAPARAPSETRYIVKPKNRSEPFWIVSAVQLRSLMQTGLVDWYERDGEMTLLEETSAPCYTEDKWDLDLVNAGEALSAGYIGEGIRIGVLDSGVNPHPELADRLLPGRNYMDGADPEDTADHYGHGTLVAGLIAGSGENGCIGPAPGAELVPIKITDGKAVTVSTVCRAIYGAIDDYGCQVLNLSLGIKNEYQSLREAVEYAEEKGVLIISAVANNGTEALNYPAAYESTAGIGGVDKSGTVYHRSNRNASVFLTAPGVNVKTLGHLGGYVTATGNSFAVPYVTAAAAILLSLEPDLTPAAVLELLASSARDLGSEGRDEAYGWGLLDISAAVAALESGAWKASEPDFTDLAEGAWYLESVRWAAENGVIQGLGDGRFDPDGTASRAMFVTMLFRMAGKPAVESDAVYQDVPADAWYADAVRWASAGGIVNGYGNGSFGPGNELTREQLAAMLYRYARSRVQGCTGSSAEALNYTDSGSVSDWAREALCWMTETGIIRGTGNGRLDPKAYATRAQVAAMLMRFSLLSPAEG